jgi:hypothetical protein
VAFVSEPFVPLATHELKGLGAPDLKFVVVAYPMGGVDPAEIVRRAEKAFPEVYASLVDAPLIAG